MNDFNVYFDYYILLYHYNYLAHTPYLYGFTTQNYGRNEIISYGTIHPLLSLYHPYVGTTGRALIDLIMSFVLSTIFLARYTMISIRCVISCENAVAVIASSRL